MFRFHCSTYVAALVLYNNRVHSASLRNDVVIEQSHVRRFHENVVPEK